MISETYVGQEIHILNDIDIPDFEEEHFPNRIHIMINFHYRKPTERFLEWLESEGLTVCRGAMPQPMKKVVERYIDHQYERRGKEPPQAAPCSDKA